jgi:hypothetical protein
MPIVVEPGDELETVSLVLRRAQAERLRAITAARRTPENRLSISMVAREVVQRGLDELFCAEDRDSSASRSSREAAA